MNSIRESKSYDTIDLGRLIKKVWACKRKFYVVWLVTFVLSSSLILCVPRYYSSSAALAPELGGESALGGSLGDIASTFGVDFGGLQTSDAISPLLYPDLMDDNGFVASLFSIRVTDSEGEIDTDYYTYLRKYQKKPWWSMIMNWLKSFIPTKKITGGGQTFDPYYLSEKDNATMEIIRSNIKFNTDKKTGVITISAEAQDKKICKILADSVTTRLQDFITTYRTNKARVDVEHYTSLVKNAKFEYEKAEQLYASFVDANRNIILQRVRGKEESLQNDLEQKLMSYKTLCSQLEAANAKLQERTPAFMILKGAAVPIKPAGPKRMIFVLGMLILVSFCYAIYIVKDDIKGSLLQTDSYDE